MHPCCNMRPITYPRSSVARPICVQKLKTCARQQQRAIQLLNRLPSDCALCPFDVSASAGRSSDQSLLRDSADDHRVWAIVHLLAAAQLRERVGNPPPDPLPHHANLKEQLGPSAMPVRTSSRMIPRVWFRICHLTYVVSSVASIPIAPPETVNGTEGKSVRGSLYLRIWKSNSDAALRKNYGCRNSRKCLSF